MEYLIDRDYDTPPGVCAMAYGSGSLDSAIRRAQREIAECPTEGQAIIRIAKTVADLALADPAAYVIYEGGDVRVEFPEEREMNDESEYNLRNADLGGANLRGADVSRANLSAFLIDRLRAENKELREALQALVSCADYVTTAERLSTKIPEWANARAALANTKDETGPWSCASDAVHVANTKED